MTFPNSTELLRMADTEWHNREERRGIHDEQSWKSGWISGYLTPDKPRPPGLCPQGTPVHVGSDEDYIECHSINECDYQASSDGPHPLCTREEAALAVAEAAEQEQAGDYP